VDLQADTVVSLFSVVSRERYRLSTTTGRLAVGVFDVDVVHSHVRRRVDQRRGVLIVSGPGGKRRFPLQIDHIS